MTIRRSLVVLLMVLAILSVACESEEDPGGDGGLGYMGDPTEQADGVTYGPGGRY